MADSHLTHTPGPWQTYPPTAAVIGPERDSDGGLVGIMVAEASWAGRAEFMANARLISAAPCLLASCRELMTALVAHAVAGLGESDRAVYERAELAVLKATDGNR